MWVGLCLKSNLERHSLYRFRLDAPKVQIGPGWAILASSERKSLVDEEPVNPIDGTAKALSSDKPVNPIDGTSKDLSIGEPVNRSMALV